LRGVTRLLAVALLLPCASAHAQGFLDEFSSEGLRLSGIGLDVGAAWSDRLDAAFSASLRADVGFVAPRIRPLLGVSWMPSRYQEDEILRLEDRLSRAVVDPSGQAVVDIDSITLTNVTFDCDVQYLFTSGRVIPYAGLGVGVHLRNVSGTAIEGTIVEDALQAIVAAVNATAGLEIQASPTVRATLEVRGLMASGLANVSVRGGAMLRFPPRSGS
jgi:hypothetical protein